MKKIRLLDCTLRDGGYINDWLFGYQNIRDIIMELSRSGVDIIEVGFLRDVDYNKEATRWDKVEDIKKLLPFEKKNTLFAAMVLHGSYDINKLSEYDGSSVDLIRVTFHDYDVKEGLQFCRQVKEKGYKVSCNPINIMGYTDKQLLQIIEQVNQIYPYAFSIVDTFGSMSRRDLERIVELLDHNLKENIILGLHLHENMAQSYSLAQIFVDKYIKREAIVDGSLMGMGRVPGNLSIELMAEYLNDNMEKNYRIDYMLDAIENHIIPIREQNPWGYLPAYFLSAKYNLHRNYAEHYLEKEDLTHKDINCLLSRISKEKKTTFDVTYADKLYDEYLDVRIDDSSDKKKLAQVLKDKSLLLIAPGASLLQYKNRILNYQKLDSVVSIAVNFIPEEIRAEYAFFTNNKRYDKMIKFNGDIITTSNLIPSGKYNMNYNGLKGDGSKYKSSIVMLLQLLSEIGIKHVTVAGADGYNRGSKNYCDNTLKNKMKQYDEYNRHIAMEMSKLDIQIEFLTPSSYHI